MLCKLLRCFCWFHSSSLRAWVLSIHGALKMQADRSAARPPSSATSAKANRRISISCAREFGCLLCPADTCGLAAAAIHMHASFAKSISFDWCKIRISLICSGMYYLYAANFAAIHMGASISYRLGIQKKYIHPQIWHKIKRQRKPWNRREQCTGCYLHQSCQ